MTRGERIASLRENYVQELKEKGSIRSPPVERAFRRVARHRFLESFYLRSPEAFLDPFQPAYLEKTLPLHPSDPNPLEDIYSDRVLVTHCDEQGEPKAPPRSPR